MIEPAIGRVLEKTDTRFGLVVLAARRARLPPGGVVAPAVITRKIPSYELWDEDALQRLGELRGPVAKELSSGLRRIIEDELEPRKLTRKLNRAIDKKRDRLRLSSEDLIDSAWWPLAKLPDVESASNLQR